MPLKDEIESARDGSLAALDSVHDYFTYSKRSWRILQAAVKRDGWAFTLRNRATNSTLTESDLLARAQQFVSADLTSATLQQFVSIFENFMSDALRLWLREYPKKLAARELKGEQILDLPDKAAIVDALIDKELAAVFYDRPVNWFKYLNDRVALGHPSAVEVEKFAEVKATRDILVHGKGVANTAYVSKAGAAARAHAGQVLDTPEPYHQAGWALIRKLVGDIGTAMAARA